MACTYLEMVQTMLFMIRSVSAADYNLCLATLYNFLKFYFALNRLNCARIISLYLFEMDHLKFSDPQIWQNFMYGEWVVNRNPDVSFCTLGANEAWNIKIKSCKSEEA